MNTAFTGTVGLTPTPFERDGALDLFAFSKLCKSLSGAGVAPAVCGAAGEARTLCMRERSALICEAVGACRGKAHVCIDPAEGDRALETAREAYALGARGLIIEAGQSAVAAGFFSFVREAASIGLPVCVTRQGGRSTLGVYAELGSIDGVEAIAEQGRVPFEALTLDGMLCGRRKTAGLPYVVCGCGETLPFAGVVGARGCICAEAALFPRRFAAILKAPAEVRAAEALRFSDLRALLCMPDAPAFLKYALHLEGLCLPTVRLPLTEPDAAAKERLDRALRQAERAGR